MTDFCVCYWGCSLGLSTRSCTNSSQRIQTAGLLACASTCVRTVSDGTSWPIVRCIAQAIFALGEMSLMPLKANMREYRFCTAITAGQCERAPLRLYSRRDMSPRLDSTPGHIGSRLIRFRSRAACARSVMPAFSNVLIVKTT